GFSKCRCDASPVFICSTIAGASYHARSFGIDVAPFELPGVLPLHNHWRRIGVRQQVRTDYRLAVRRVLARGDAPELVAQTSSRPTQQPEMDSDIRDANANENVRHDDPEADGA